MANSGSNKQLFKKWWFWAIIVVVLGVIGLLTQDTTTNTDTANETPASNSQQQEKPETYAITGEVLGEYGREVTLNKNSDMPVKKYLYKLPAGTYKVTTTYDKMANFFIVKDKIGVEAGNTDYPEVLDYVGNAYMLTAGDDDFNGKAKKEVVITLGEDESVQITGTEKLILEKQ